MRTRWLPLWSLSLLVAALLGPVGCSRESAPRPGAAEQPEPEAPRGPNGGRLLTDGDFALELAIFEAGVPPEFHAWATQGGRPIAPREVELTVELARLGGAVDRIGFAPSGELLRGDAIVREPHSFDVSITAVHAGQTHRWAYESYEGRTTIAPDVAAAAGIETAIAGPGVIAETLVLYGVVNPDITRVREVRARFPGVIRSVSRQIGDTVRAGETLATIESNESLQTYTVSAPIAGVVTARHAEPGEQTDTGDLFEIADFSSVWAEFNVFPRDRARVRQGQSVAVTAEGGVEDSGTIGYLSPVGDRASQSLAARVVLDNADGRWTPGQFVEGGVTLVETSVALAVPLAALQTFRDFDVVFARVGDTYEVRMLTLGRRDAAHVEVLDGLAPGTVYVAANSYLVKADIEKAGASHDH
jgi:cobalt-zinc-cadmium efflux system membrane fusion protein